MIRYQYILLIEHIDKDDINNPARARGPIISRECVECVVVDHIMIVVDSHVGDGRVQVRPCGERGEFNWGI